MITDVYQPRDVVVVPLPLSDSIQGVKKETIVLKFGERKHLDIGCVCYLNRRFSINRTQSTTSCVVELSSFSQKRIWLVESMVQLLSNEISSGTRRSITAFQWAKTFRDFMNWCDKNNFLAEDCSRSHVELALNKFVDYLRDTVQNNAKSLNVQAKTQNVVIRIFRHLFQSEDIGLGINLLISRSNAYKATPVPSESNQSMALAWLRALFHGLSDFVLTNARYPARLTVPEHLHWPENSIWIFPFAQWAISPGRERTSMPLVQYDEGRLLSEDEFIGLNGKGVSVEKVRMLRKRLVTSIDNANSAPGNKHRIRRAMCAQSAFIELFIAETAMNPSQVFNLPWSSEMTAAMNSPSTERQRFRSVKYRAAGRIVSFEIGAKFLNEFRKFIRLREYLLGENHCSTLFFTINTRTGWAPEPFKMNRIYHSIRKLDPTLRPISHREWRAAKQDWAIRNTDPVIAAKLLQHSEITSLRAYSNGSQVSHEMEMGDFFNHVDQIILEKRKADEVTQVISLGLCTSPDQPEPVTDTGIIPVCGKPEGCLFCDKYRVHSDETDIHKLLSCRYCVVATSGLATTEEQHSDFFGPVLQRIDFILEELARRLPAEYMRLKKEVEEYGELTPYWQTKLEMLQELNLI